MTRIKDKDTGIVHFVNPAHAGFTLCAMTNGMDLLGHYMPLGVATSDPVNCPGCAKVACAIRNEPYNTLVDSMEPSTLEEGVYAAVEPPTGTIKEKDERREEKRSDGHDAEGSVAG